MNSSSAKERRALILQMLEQKPEVQVTEISRETGISEVTIRKQTPTPPNPRRSYA